MQEDAHGIHSKGLSPTQFQVDALWIERVRLPHLKFVDGVGGNVIAADEPGLMGIPVDGGLFCPAARGWISGGLSQGQEARGKREREGKREPFADVHGSIVHQPLERPCNFLLWRGRSSHFLLYQVSPIIPHEMSRAEERRWRSRRKHKTE